MASEGIWFPSTQERYHILLGIWMHNELLQLPALDTLYFFSAKG